MKKNNTENFNDYTKEEKDVDDYIREEYEAILIQILKVYIDKLVMFHKFSELRDYVDELMDKVSGLTAEFFDA